MRLSAFWSFLLFGLLAASQLAAQTFPTVPTSPPVSLRDAALRDWLRTNWYDGKRTTLGYNQARAKLYNYVDNQAGQVRCVYSGYTEAKALNFNGSSYSMTNINCEHTVPQSWFDEVERMRSDLHHLFPAVVEWNADRSNKPFFEIPDNQTTKWIRGLNSQAAIPTADQPEWSENNSSRFEPRDDHKGNLARAVFYFYTMHSGQSFDAGKNVITAIGDLNTFYQWHLADPVDAQEQLRNRRAAASQGNYNPYINDPSLVARAWGFAPLGSTPTVQFAAATGSQPEGNSSTSSYVLTVILSAEPTATATVQVAVDAAGSTAASSSDYTFTTPQTLTFGPGQPLSQSLTVTVNGDATVEPDETLRLLLQSPSGPIALGTPTVHTLTIANEDVAPASALNFASATGSQLEGNSGTITYTVNVTLSPAASGTVTVPVQVDAANTSADASDYTLTTTSLTFTAGQTSRPVSVSVNGDALVEPDEVLRLRLGTPTGGAVLGTASTHTLTIRNDDAASGTGELSCGGLFFSEYIESTSGNNKALEIYNPSDEVVNLAGYRVQLFANGAAAATATLDLSGELGGREVFVIINNQSTDPNFLEQGDAVSGVTNFNGDDALVLSYLNTTLDALGLKGERPASGGWTVPGGSTKDYTLRRNAAITQGQGTWSTATAEWTAVGQDVYDDLGSQAAVQCGDGPLPVTLTRFSARRSGAATVLLRWQTAQELHSSHFIVEKSADGQQFSASGQVTGSGTSTGPRQYQLTDADAAGAAYYRLRSVDIDGTKAISSVTYVAAALPQLALLPNPTTGTVTLLGLPMGAPVRVALHSLQGQLLLPWRSTTAAAEQLSAALRSVGPGVYVATVELEEQRYFLKVLKQ